LSTDRITSCDKNNRAMLIYSLYRNTEILKSGSMFGPRILVTKDWMPLQHSAEHKNHIGSQNWRDEVFRL